MKEPNRDDLVASLLDAPDPDAAAQSDSLEAMLDAVAQKRRRQGATRAIAATMCVLAVVGVLLLELGNRAAGPADAPAIAQHRVSVVETKSQPTVRLVETRADNYTRIDAAELFGMFPDSPTILIGEPGEAQKLVVVQVAGALSPSEERVLHW